MKLSPDDNILVWFGPAPISATIAYTWLVMAILFVGLAMVEPTGIYSLVVSMILIFANPFWDHFVSKAGGMIHAGGLADGQRA